MANHNRTRHPRLFAAAVVTAALSGCASKGPIMSRQTTVGSLKAGVSQLEFDNRQLRKQVADLKVEKRDVEDRLVQEEAANGEISARLDDARNVLSRREGVLPGDTELTSTEPPSNARKTLPAGRTSRPGRKAPFAQIPGRIDPVSPSRDDTDDAAQGRSRWNKDPGPQSMRDELGSWLPVAQTPPAPAPKAMRR